MANVILFHSIFGLRKNILDIAECFRKNGHTVYAPDLLNGEVFSDLGSANNNLQKIGVPEIIRRSKIAVENMPNDIVYAGFSLGGVVAQLLAAQRKGAKGCLLFHSAQPLAALKIEAWPSKVPVQIHFAKGDPWRKQENIKALSNSVRQAGTDFQYFEYPCTGHLFADSQLPDYDQASAELMIERALEFLNLAE
jgi:dienelactone hydrolase